MKYVAEVIFNLDTNTGYSKASQVYSYLIPDYIEPQDVKDAGYAIVENAFSTGAPYKPVKVLKVVPYAEAAKATKPIVDILRVDQYKNAKKLIQNEAAKAEKVEQWWKSLSLREKADVFQHQQIRVTLSSDKNKNIPFEISFGDLFTHL